MNKKADGCVKRAEMHLKKAAVHHEHAKEAMNDAKKEMRTEAKIEPKVSNKIIKKHEKRIPERK